MKSILIPRRWGKSTELLKLASKEKISIFVGYFNNSAEKSFKLNKYLIEDMVVNKDPINLTYTFENGNILMFKSFKEAQREEFKDIPKFVDEAPYLLEDLLGNVKAFSGTTERMFLDRNPPEHLGSMREFCGEMSGLMTDEEFYRQVLGLPFNQEKK